MDCTNCGAPLPPKTTRCTFCQTINDIDLRGQVTFQPRTTSRDCPHCRQTLDAVSLQVGTETIEIDRCATCFGLFFDPQELDAVLDGIETRAETVDHRQLLMLIEQETPTDDFAEVVYVPCPDCGQLMHRRRFGQRSGVIVDSCRDHGTWLDGGELRRLIRWTQAGGRRHHATQEAERQRLEKQLQKTKSEVQATPMPEGYFDTGTASSPFTSLGNTLEAVDLLSTLASVVRWLR